MKQRSACLVALICVAVRAHAQSPTFTVRSYSGKCLDVGTPPQVAHAPLFIATCNGGIGQRVGVEEINARHEVILHAGTKVLGMRGFSTHPLGDESPRTR